MLTLVSVILVVSTGLLSIPAMLLLVEVLAAINPVKEQPLGREEASVAEKILAVIIPAHNESVGIIPTLEDVRSQLHKNDRLIVVADNCSDDTAEIAASTGAEVIARSEPEKVGKGYALNWGMKHLSISPPDFVLFIDADCRIYSDMIGRLKEFCNRHQRPAQAFFRMKTGENSPINHSLAEFAWVLRNWVRPLGLRNLGFPVQLNGTGMIFPWEIIGSASLASGNLVEDMKLGLDLAAEGHAAKFFPFVIGTSDFPQSLAGTTSQRQRWVQGHIGMISKAVPRLLALAAIRRNSDLFMLALDLAIPPLSLLGILIIGSFLLASLAAFFSLSFVALVLATLNLLAFTIAVYFGWLKFGRDVLSAYDFLSLGPFLLQKMLLYSRMLLGGKAGHWIRADRAKSK